jgi:putative ABC transport system substrate-binding protein
MSYAASIAPLYGEVASYIDRILRGAKPGDLPVQQPATFELVLNLKTASALGIKLPRALLLRADKVIE